MNIALCHENVTPSRGGCETYITDLARRLLVDRHEVHLYACRWDEQALPVGLHYHALPAVSGPRFTRPWRFAARCLEALGSARHDLSIGFDKTWGQDVLMPLGGLHTAAVAHNIHKHPGWLGRSLARLCKTLDLAHWSFTLFQRRQYLSRPRPRIIAPSRMVARHFEHYHGIPADEVQVVHCAIDPGRFADADRPRRRLTCRARWCAAPGDTVGLMVAKNYRLKGLTPLLHAVQRLLARDEVRKEKPGPCLVVAGGAGVRRYQRLARQLGIGDHIRFLGACPDIRDAYCAADFLVHPTFYDPCSLVVLEALACGLPVITSRSNGASELLQPLEAGMVIDDPHDHDHLASCLARMRDPDQRAAWARAARQIAARWTYEHHYQKLLALLQTTAEGKRSAA
jgi:UDP-glucose:(heptosyl)LPS alpha-1,3-glucosyltransferase